MPRDRKGFILLASAIIAVIGIASASHAGGIVEAQAPPTEFGNPTVPYEIADDLSAVTFLRPFAEAGNAEAQLLMGRLYIDSVAVPRDCDAGLRWLFNAAGARNADAAFEIGILYEEGTCIAPSQSSSLAWFLQSARYGNAAAANAIGELYLGGEEVGPDDQRAFYWFFKGVRSLDQNACFYIGLMYREGLSVARDNQQAYLFFDLSFHLSPIFSAERDRAMIERDQVRETLMPNEVLTARSDAHRLLIALLMHHEREADLLMGSVNNTVLKAIR